MSQRFSDRHAICPSVQDILHSVDLPNPTTPVPFERFAALKDSNDIMVRAAFWCFYAAWVNDHRERENAGGTEVWSHHIGIEARHDGHSLNAVAQQCALRDAVLVQRAELHRLQTQPHSPYLVTYSALWWSIGFALVMGLLIGWLAHGIV